MRSGFPGRRGLDGRAVTRERMAGYLEVLAAEGMEPLVLTGKATRTFGREAAGLLADHHSDCDGVLCFNDLVALGVLAGCAKAGRRVGADMLVVGFDDIEDAAQSWPSLTTVRCDIAAFGRQTAATILDLLENGIMPAAETRSPVRLIVRQSSQPGQAGR